MAVLAFLFFGSISAYAEVSNLTQPVVSQIPRTTAKNLIAQTPVIDNPASPSPEQPFSGQPSSPPSPLGPGVPNTIPSFAGPNVPSEVPEPPSPAGPSTSTPPGQATPGITPMPQGTTPPPARPASTVIRAQPTTVMSGGGSSFFFDDADVFEVIQTVFGEVLRVNYIVDPQVKGRVNFRTTAPIPKDKILSIMEIILRLNGIAVVEESGLYRIIPIGNIAKEPAPIRFGKDPEAIELKGTALLQIVPLTYINSSEMSAILTPLLTQGGAIHDISKKNILIIADTDANVRRLLQVVSLFDIDTYKDASQPKVYVYPLQNSKAEHVAKILQQVILGGSATTPSGSGVKTTTGGTTTPSIPTAGPTGPQPTSPTSSSGASLVAPGTKVIADEVTNSLVIYASPGDYSIILGAIKQIDTMPRQVMIEAIVASVTMTDNLTLGMRWNLNVGTQKLDVKPFIRPIVAGGPLGFQGLSPLTSGFGYFATDSKGQVRLAIEADATTGKSKILSAPQILVADNREARIQVGQQIPIATSTTSTPITSTSTTVANATTSTIQYKDVGTILKVKPQINDSGLISLELSQEVSSFATQSILGTDQAIITKNEVSTNLVAQDGETIVIGGLVNETDSTSRDAIPLLGKIPVLGYLFGRTADQNSRQELVILLTPHVVRNQADAEKMTSDFYELFKNVGKEFKLEKHKKSTQTPQQSDEKASPKNLEKPNGKASAPESSRANEKASMSAYPLSSNDN